MREYLIGTVGLPSDQQEDLGRAYGFLAEVTLIGRMLLRRNRVVKIPLLPDAIPGTVPHGELPVLAADMLFERTGTRRLVDALRTKLGLPLEMFEGSVWPVMAAFAEFVQLLPASESHHHAEPGGLLIHALEVANLALEYRRGQILPKGASPEAIGEQAHRWTYAVFAAALLHDVGKPMADLRVFVRKGVSASERWSPLAGSMVTCGATSYRVEFAERSARRYELHGKLAVLLLNRFVPASILGWLSTDSGLFQELLSYLAGDKTGEEGMLHQLESRADAESVRRNLLGGSRVRFVSARRVPLIERLMHALRTLLKEGGRLPLNRSGAAGWVYQGEVWFVSKRLADEVRKYLQEIEVEADGVPADNQRLFDTWQEYGALIPNPQTGGAVWHINVAGAGYRHALTVLRFPLGVLYSNQSEYPPQMLGSVEVSDANTGSGGESDLDPSALTDRSPRHPVPARVSVGAKPASEPASVKSNAMAENRSTAKPAQSDIATATTDESELSEDEEEYLEDVEAKPRGGASERHKSGPACEPAPLMRAAASLSQQPPPSYDGVPEAPDAARRFMGWLQQGLADKSIRVNESGALVHFVPEGMFLVSPRVFKEFARRFGEDGRGVNPGAAENDADLGKSIQRQLLRACWHLQAEKGVNILTYQVMTRSGRAVAQLSGVVIKDPARFVRPLPPVNRVLTRLAAKDRAA